MMEVTERGEIYAQAAKENHENSRDNCMYQTLDNFLGHQEQSYDEFVSAFTYLTKEDVLKQPPKPTVTPVCGEEGPSTIAPAVLTSETEEEEELEEEVLDEGTRVSTMSNLPGCSTGSVMVKVDNFVDCEGGLGDNNVNDDDINALLSAGGYSASFGEAITLDQGQTTIVNPDVEASRDDGNKTHKAQSMDAGNIMTMNAENSSDGEESQEADFINPGEVHDFETIHEMDSLKNQTHLECSTTVGEVCSENGSIGDDLAPGRNSSMESSGYTSEVSHDEVESFHLDPTFDYDNVTFTPKYSEADLHILMRSVNMGQESAAS